MTALYLVGNGGELGLCSAENQIALVFADHGLVRGNRNDGHVVDAAKLTIGGKCRARHAGELLVQAEVVLQGNGRDSVRLGFDLDVFLRLDGLVEALGIAAALHDAARKSIDNLHLAPIDHVIMVNLEEELRLERLTQSVRGSPRQIGVHFAAEQFLDFREASLGLVHGAALLVENDVRLGIKPCRNIGEAVAYFRRSTGEPRDDKGRARLVDEDRIGLVDDGERVPALHALAGRRDHVIAEVVEAELGVGTVRDRSGIRRPALVGLHAVLNEPNLHPKQPVDAPNPFRVALRQVVVDGDDVDGLARQRVQKARGGGNERLALPGLHLGDAPVV